MNNQPIPQAFGVALPDDPLTAPLATPHIPRTAL